MSTDWMTELQEIISSVDRADRAIQDLTRWVWDNVVASDVLPRQLPKPVSTHLGMLHEELERMRESSGEAFARYSSGPSRKALASVPLSREEYYLCRAMGVDFGTAREVGLADVDDYEVYRMLCYEDDRWRGYINVHLTASESRPTPIALRYGRSPEECRSRFLRPEQHDFFRAHLPSVYERFADDPEALSKEDD